jgi:RimJ/RimL family protein N-acetyltransferase
MNYWQGQHIRLRAVEPSDAETFVRWNLDSDRARHLDFVWPPQSLAAVQTWCEEQSKKKPEKDDYFWLIVDAHGEPVGTIATHQCSPRTGTFMYGLDIAEEHRRRGYASEAIRLILRYYFDELRYQKCNVTVHSNNEASLRLHESLGFTREGTIRRMVYTDGQYFDDVWFGITAEELRGQNSK